MSWALSALQVVLAAVLVWAAIAKFLQADEFIAALRLSRVLEPAVLVLAVAVPVAEIGLGLWLLAAPATLPWAFIAVGGLFLVFTLWMVSVRLRGLHVRCGCFGAKGGQVGERTIARNVLLLLVATLGWLIARSVAPAVHDASLWWALTVIALALVLTMVAVARFALPHMSLSEPASEAGPARE